MYFVSQGHNVVESSFQVPVAVVGGVSAVLLAVAAVLGVYLRRKHVSRNSGKVNIDLPDAAPTRC